MNTDVFSIALFQGLFLENTSICIWCLKVPQNQARLYPNIIQSAISQCTTGFWEREHSVCVCVCVVILRLKAHTCTHAHSYACERSEKNNRGAGCRRGESTHNEFNNVQSSLKHSSQPLWRCHSCQISGAEIWLVPSGNSPYGPSAWQHRDPQQMCCFSVPWWWDTSFVTPVFSPKSHNNVDKWDWFAL